MQARINWLIVSCRHNLQPGEPVAICMERSARMVVGLLAILKAGGAYVPMGPRYPEGAPGVHAEGYTGLTIVDATRPPPASAASRAENDLPGC